MDLPLRPHVRRMQPYAPGKPVDELAREQGLQEIVKLASNENPLGPSPRAVEAIVAAARDLHYYPDASGYSVRSHLAERLGLGLDQIALGNGSDDLIANLAHAVIGDERDDEIVVGQPSFVRYAAATQLANCRLTEVPMDGEMRYDLSAMADAVTERTRLVIFANPNNPTGTIARREEFTRFLDTLPAGVLVVMDEAYYEYASSDPEYPRTLEFVTEGRPVFVLRTLSKAYGLAGLRLGYGFGPAALVDAIDRVRQPFAVNALAQAGAIAALDDREHLERTLEANERGMAAMSGLLAELGLKAPQSHANFLLVDFGRPARPIYEALLAQGVIVRPGDVLGAPHHLRMSIGTESQIGRLATVLRSVVAQGAAV